MTAPEVSHGRGGAGNINPDDTQYVDGEIVRQGDEGPQGAGPYSAGRGGNGNIGEAGQAAAPRTDEDFVPDAATRPPPDEDFHVGRGGAANVHLSSEHQKQQQQQQNQAAKDGDDKPITGLADKLKNKVMGLLKK